MEIIKEEVPSWWSEYDRFFAEVWRNKYRNQLLDLIREAAIQSDQKDNLEKVLNFDISSYASDEVRSGFYSYLSRQINHILGGSDNQACIDLKKFLTSELAQLLEDTKYELLTK